jgi:hypothetical protein
MAKRAKGSRLMDEDTKRRFDGIVELWKHCWQSVAERRKNEWRAAYTLWTAFAALIVLILRGELRRAQTNYFPFVLVLIFGLALCFIHGWWLVGIGRRHSINRRMAVHYEDILRTLSNSDFDEELKKRLKGERKKQEAEPWFRVLFCDWSRRVQFSVTVLLFLLALVVTVLPTAVAKGN